MTHATPPQPLYLGEAGFTQQAPRTPLTQLLSIKATLEKWLAPNTLGRTDDLLKMLRTHHSNEALYQVVLDVQNGH